MVYFLFLQVEKELKDICSDILGLLDKHLIPTASSGESRVFFYKMKGDYHRWEGVPVSLRVLKEEMMSSWKTLLG